MRTPTRDERRAKATNKKVTKATTEKKALYGRREPGEQLKDTISVSRTIPIPGTPGDMGEDKPFLYPDILEAERMLGMSSRQLSYQMKKSERPKSYKPVVEPDTPPRSRSSSRSGSSSSSSSSSSSGSTKTRTRKATPHPKKKSSPKTSPSVSPPVLRRMPLLDVDLEPEPEPESGFEYTIDSLKLNKTDKDKLRKGNNKKIFFNLKKAFPTMTDKKIMNALIKEGFHGGRARTLLLKK